MKLFFIKRKSTGNFCGFEVYPESACGEYSAETSWELEEVIQKTDINGKTYFTEIKIWCSASKKEAENVIRKSSKSYEYGKSFEFPEHNFDDLEIVEKEI